MLHVMIADDEQYEREYLKKVIAEKYEGILQVVYMASDGADLLEMTDQYLPEIALLDIRMPRLDGLETAAQLLRKYPDIQIVIVSAYDEFSYAKQAMKLGIRDFLVKPYLDGELVEIMDKLLVTLGSTTQRRGRHPEEGSSAAVSKDSDKDILWDLAFGRKTETLAWKELARRGIAKCSFKSIVFYHRGILRLETRSCDIVKGIFHLKGIHVLVSYLLDQMTVYVFSEDSDIYVELNRCIRKTRAYLSELGEGTVFCGVSGIYPETEPLKNAFDEASGYILDYADKQAGRQFEETLLHCRQLCDDEEKAGFAAANVKEEEGSYWIGQMMDILNQYYGTDTAENPLQRHIMTIIRRLNQHQDIQITPEDIEAMANLFSDPQLSAPALARQIMEKLTANARSIPLNHNVAVVRNAKDYIKEHYKESIGLQDVAKALDISYSHLSRCFRNVEGIPFTNYLTEVRLEQAKELMRAGRMTIQEIAYAVGFTDPNYFGKCFKKHERISPSEYCAMQVLAAGAADPNQSQQQK